jgi:hypothetical protein
MVRIDETQEAIARIRMTIDNHDKAIIEAAQAGSSANTGEDEKEDEDESPVDPQATDHWTFGAPVPGRLINSRAIEDMEGRTPPFKNFDMRLRLFISETWPEEGIKFEDTITVRVQFFLSLCSITDRSV